MLANLEQVIEGAYRAAVLEKPYNSVSVKELCERAGISRKVFYRRFKSKDDVLCWIFARDIVNPQIELCDLLPFEKVSALAASLEHRMYDTVYSDGEFYRAIVVSEPGGRKAFANVAHAAFRELNSKMLGYAEFKGSDMEASYIASFLASGKAELMSQWVAEDFPCSPEDMSTAYLLVAKPFWDAVAMKENMRGGTMPQ